VSTSPSAVGIGSEWRRRGHRLSSGSGRSACILPSGCPSGRWTSSMRYLSGLGDPGGPEVCRAVWRVGHPEPNVQVLTTTQRASSSARRAAAFPSGAWKLTHRQQRTLGSRLVRTSRRRARRQHRGECRRRVGVVDVSRLDRLLETTSATRRVATRISIETVRATAVVGIQTSCHELCHVGA
jgi:hypothetical protein